jgi:nitric oxide reductase NorD protein
MYGRVIDIEVADPLDRVGWIGRLVDRVPRHLRSRASIPATDGVRIHLPAELDATTGVETAFAQYRLFALEQGERIARGTLSGVASENDPLVRDLYFLRESVAVDCTIARTIRGVLPSLAAARAAASLSRPAPDALSPVEREVEVLLQRALSADPAQPPPDLGGGGAPSDSLTWARGRATTLRTVQGRYRGLPPVTHWGRVLPPGTATTRPPVPLVAEQTSGTKRPYLDLPTSSVPPREAGAGNPGVYSQRSREPAEQPQDLSDDPQGAPRAIQDGTTRDAGAAGGLPRSSEAPPAVPYPEWDCTVGRYRQPGALVRPRPAGETDAAWATQVLARYAVLVRRVRHHFERLRARRTRLGQQRDGDELDLAACVHALVDRRSGYAADDRLYVAVRPARRALAITLLVDVSGSTDAPVNETLQVIDLEKVAVLVASEALDALGDLYAVLTFSSKGPEDVRVTTIKDFADRNGEMVRRRISALEPQGNTRLGAALRHATTLLVRQPAGHRLLLILSDGRPNDVGLYQGDYGVEDARQAINEARATNVYPFCLTVDREESAYLARIFGPAGYTILQQPDHLPLALLKVVRQLLASS